MGEFLLWPETVLGAFHTSKYILHHPRRCLIIPCSCQGYLTSVGAKWVEHGNLPAASGRCTESQPEKAPL